MEGSQCGRDESKGGRKGIKQGSVRSLGKGGGVGHPH